MPFTALTTARDLGRLQEIAGVFIRHGLGDLVRRLGWTHALETAGRAVHATHAADLALLEPPEQLRRALEELGPTFVKLGQILAGRADLFGPAWIAEFEKLHSQAPPSDPAALMAQLVEDLGGEPQTVFARFDPEPLAAASIAQVHAATLQDGSEVIVKVRRPGIEPLIEADLRLLERLAALAEREWPELKPYQPVQLVRRLGRSLRRELDLAHECRNAERIAAHFAQHPEVVVPSGVLALHPRARERAGAHPRHSRQRAGRGGRRRAGPPPARAARRRRRAEDGDRGRPLPCRSSPGQCLLPERQPPGLHRFRDGGHTGAAAPRPAAAACCWAWCSATPRP